MSGGLACIYSDGDIQASPMPDTEKDIWDWFNLKQVGNDIFAVIEKVHAMPGNGVSSMFKFGQSYGFLRACLIAAEMPFQEISPQKWQKALGVNPREKDESKPDFKKRLKGKAQQLYPSTNITLKNADAALIATYCKQVFGKSEVK